MKIEPYSNALGARVTGIDLSRTIPSDVFEELYQAYLDHLLLVFHEQPISDENLISLAKRFGDLRMPPAAHERASHQESDSPPEITVVSNVTKNGVAIGELGDGEVAWHSDFSFSETPGGMRILRGVKVPPPAAGANTFFANMYSAYDTLSSDLRHIALSHSIKHDNVYDTNKNIRMGATLSDNPLEGTGPIHPMVHTHPETKANSLFLGRRFKHYIIGYSMKESDEILDAIWEHATSAHHSIEHVWAQDDIVLWDNRCTLHRRGPFDPKYERILHAAQVKGQRPSLSSDASKLPPHPRARLMDQIK